MSPLCARCVPMFSEIPYESRNGEDDGNTFVARRDIT